MSSDYDQLLRFALVQVTRQSASILELKVLQYKNIMSNLSVAIVGAGLVGALGAYLLARRDYQVTLFEERPDGRNEPNYYGRLINLAISLRGISALKRLDLDHIVQERAIPMKARMIHSRNRKLGEIPYDPDGRCIDSIERASLNNYLLNKAEKQFNVTSW